MGLEKTFVLALFYHVCDKVGTQHDRSINAEVLRN